MKFFRSGIFWGLLAFVLAAALYLAFIRPGSQEDEPVIESTATPALTRPLYADTLVPVRLALSDRSGLNFAMSRSGSGQMWLIEQPRPALAEQGVAEMAATQLLTVRVINQMEGASLAVVGLDSPAYTLTVAFSDGSEDVIRIGGKTPTNSGYYAVRNEGPVLVLTRKDLEPLLGLLTYPPYQPTPAGP